VEGKLRAILVLNLKTFTETNGASYALSCGLNNDLK
jgi:hypothetical protein